MWSLNQIELDVGKVCKKDLVDAKTDSAYLFFQFSNKINHTNRKFYFQIL